MSAQPTDTAAVLRAYLRLHDFLSDAIESGRLTEADIPDDYAAIVAQLEECARLEGELRASTYSLAEVRDGTGWAAGVRFAAIFPEG